MQTATPGRIGNFISDHLEWIFAGLLVAGVTIYFWRQNSRLRKSDNAEKKGEKAKAPHPGQPEILPLPPMSANRTNSPQLPATTNRTNAPQLPNQPVGSTQQDARDRQATNAIPSGIYIPATPPADPLADAKGYFDNGDSKAFYRELNRAIWKAVGRKLDLPASELNKSNAARQLRLRGWDETALLSLENILNECEMNLYTPAYDRFNMEQLLRQTERLLERLA